MTNEKTLAQTLAENRARGAVLASTRSLFPAKELPSWASLRLTWHVRFLWLFLGLYFVSLYLVWSSFLHAFPSFVQIHSHLLLFAAAANYLLLIGTASAIQAQLHAAQLQKYGGMAAIFLALFLNPFALGWLVPVYVLSQVGEVRRRLGANAANPRSFG